MGVPSSTFGKPRPRSNSLVLEWAEEKVKDFLGEDEMTPDGVFVGLIYGLTTFVRPRPVTRSGKEEESCDLNNEFEAQYANDAVLFELGCHMYSWISAWLFLHRAELYRPITMVFLRHFTDLFAWALQIANVSDLLDERVSQYVDFVGTENAIQKSHDCLYALILRTKGNRKPEHYDFGNEPAILEGAVEEFALRTKLQTWETIMLPTLIGSVEEATAMMQSGPNDKDAT